MPPSRASGATGRKRADGQLGGRRGHGGRPASRHSGHRNTTSFVLLVLTLLGLCLGCLLVVNTTLAANSIRISDLQQTIQTSTQYVQQLRQQVAAEGSAAVIAREARRLHMRSGQPWIVDLGTGKITNPGADAGVAASLRAQPRHRP